MIKNTLCELAAIYGRVRCGLTSNGNYHLEINDKPALLFNPRVILTVCNSQCSNVYCYHGQNYHSHEFNTDKEYLLELVSKAFKQTQVRGVPDAA